MDLHLELSLETEAPRIDVALLDTLRIQAPNLSRATLKEYFKNKQILCNGNAISASTTLPAGSHSIQIRGWNPSRAETPRASASENGCFLPVVYEDEDLLVLHKRSGTPSIPHSPEETETAVGAALARHPELVDLGRGGLESAILHRLDTGTSGLIVFARHNEEFTRLRAAWSTPAVKKRYRALVRQRKESEAFSESVWTMGTHPFLLDWPMGHDLGSTKRMVAIPPGLTRSIRGKELEARTRILKTTEIATGLFDVHVEIETGVMHQIRCHLASQGWPILGDPIYHGTPSSRLWLHAWQLILPLRSGAILELQADLPERWATRATENSDRN